MGLRRTAIGIAGAAVLSATGAASIAVAQQPKLAPPSFGRSVDIGLVSGTVIVTPPRQGAFRLGTQDRNIPIGSLIDTSHGRVDLRAASRPSPGNSGGGAGRVQDAEFYDGAFTVKQSPASALAQIRLAGEKLSQCAAPAGAQHLALSRAKLSHHTLRLLNASGTGRFETEGRYASATVRGTIWLTEDFCDGTLVAVTRGVVTVENLVTHATVTVTAGHRYFATAPAMG
jgi:hypothetical protein